MSRIFTIGPHFRPKRGMYSWPSMRDQDRTIELFEDDVLTPDAYGGYTKHTGLCCVGIVVPTDCLTFYPGSAELEML
jgi:hypothetical protein